MNEYLIYLLNVSFCSSVFYLFYYCFLRREIFFRANRIYLIGSLLGSFVIPVLHIGPDFLTLVSTQVTLYELIPDNFEFETFTSRIHSNHLVSVQTILNLTYFTGMCMMLARFSFLIIKIMRLTKVNQTSKIEKNRFVYLENGSMPFSFFRFIFIDPAKIREANLSKPIIEHEKVHARELHSLDLIIAEIVTILLWFNPFVFFYRSSIKENHEYLADSGVIRSGINPVDYILALANEVFRNHSIGLTSSFKCSTTKKRLVMITKINTSKKRWLKFTFIIPMVVLLLAAFAKPTAKPVMFSFIKPSAMVRPAFLNFTKPMNFDSIGNDIPSIMPLDERNVSQVSGWGMRMHPTFKIKKFHPAIDFKAPMGTPVFATASGSVEIIKNQTVNQGNYIIIRHGNQYKTLYSHLYDIIVAQGDKIVKGQVIGHVGNTGISTGAHLHYEVIKDGINVNPQGYLSGN